jgi:hypothetical protein
MAGQFHDRAAQARPVWPPEPGFFKLRLCAGGWHVPALIRRRDDGTWQAVIDTDPLAPSADPATAPGVARIWHGGVRIGQPEYDWLLAIREHAHAHDPEHPAAQPRRPIHPMRLKPFHATRTP